MLMQPAGWFQAFPWQPLHPVLLARINTRVAGGMGTSASATWHLGTLHKPFPTVANRVRDWGGCSTDSFLSPKRAINPLQSTKMAFKPLQLDLAEYVTQIVEALRDVSRLWNSSSVPAQRASSSLAGDSTTSVGNLLQCWSTFMVKHHVFGRCSQESVFPN